MKAKIIFEDHLDHPFKAGEIVEVSDTSNSDYYSAKSSKFSGVLMKKTWVDIIKDEEKLSLYPIGTTFNLNSFEVIAHSLDPEYPYIVRDQNGSTFNIQFKLNSFYKDNWDEARDEIIGTGMSDFQANEIIEVLRKKYEITPKQ